MERITYRITLDAHKNGIQRTLQGFETADNMARRIAVNLTAGGDTYELPYDNTVALIYITTPNAKEPSINECVIKDDTIVYDMLPVVEEGITEMQIKLIKTSIDGAKSVIAAPKFAIEVTKSNTDDESVEQTTTFTALENAVARANAVYDARLVRIEIDEEYTFRAYYADGAVYENDVAGEQIRMLTGYVELMKEHIADAKESAENASVSEENARVSAETAAECAEIAVKSTEEQGNFLEWYTEAKKMVSEEAVVQLREDVDKFGEIFIEDNSVDCISGLKGFYYKAVDKVHKIIYLTKNRLYDGNYYYYALTANLIKNGSFEGTPKRPPANWSAEDPMKGYVEDLEGLPDCDPRSHGLRVSSKTAMVSQIIDVEPKKTYELTGYVYLQGVRARVYVGGYSDAEATNITDATKGLNIYTDTDSNNMTFSNETGDGLARPTINTWNKFTYTFTTGEDTEYLKLVLTGLNGTSFFDDIVLHEVELQEVELDLYYSENAVGKLLSVCNSKKFENSLKIKGVESGKIYYELVDEIIDPFETASKLSEVDIDDFTLWCNNCHDEGTVDLGIGSFATGDNTKALNRGAHTQNIDTIARGEGSSAEGCGTVARTNFQHVQGKYNVPDTKGEYAHIVGNGTSDDERSNAHTLDWEGNAEYAGDVIAKGCGGAEPVSLIDVNAKLSKSSTQVGDVSTQLDNLIKQLGDIDTLMRKSACTFDAETGTLTVTL